MADTYANLTPYNYSFNDPVYWNDPLGDCPTCKYQRSDDTWWVAPRDQQGGYAVYGSRQNWAYQNRNDNWAPQVNPWAWTGIDPYGSGVDWFGTGYVPGEYMRNGQAKEEVWMDYYVLENGNYIDSELVGYRYSDRKQGRSQTQGCPSCLDPSTVGNWFFIYGGPNNPLSYDGSYNYELSPTNVSDKIALVHDQDYDKKGAVGGLDLVLNLSVVNDDIKFVKNQFRVTGAYISQYVPNIMGLMVQPTVYDPVTKAPMTMSTALNSFIQAVGLEFATAPKIIVNQIGGGH